MKPSPAISLISWRMMLLTMASLAPAFGFCALSWDAQKIELTAKPDDKQAVGVFRFKNGGSEAVTITAIQPSCGCTTAELAKRTYAPGETGEIKATFSFGGRVGQQEKTIQVTTNDAPDKPVPLVLHVNIPELLTCSPRLLLWRTAEVLTDKSVILTNTGPQKITAIEVNGAPSIEVTVRIEAIEPGTKYRIAVQPASLTKTATIPLSFLARFTDNTTHPFMVYALVK